MSPEVTLRLLPDVRAPRAARRAVVDTLSLRDGLAHDAALLISEAVTNSVLHANLTPESRIHVDAWWAGERLRVEVCDDGDGLSSPSPAGPGPDRDGGHGLGIISALADRWGVVSDGHTRIWFELAA